MDLGTIIGLVMGFGCIIYGSASGGDIGSFIHIESLVIVLGGGVASTVISSTMDDLTNLGKVFPIVFKTPTNNPFNTIQQLVDMSQKARREGLLALESSQDEIDDDYLKKALELVVDGVEPDIIKESMQLELDNMDLRHARGIKFFETLGSLFPAWGMIGTLMGLVNLLGQMDDPSAIGPAMAVALITTFYGSVFANFFCIPFQTTLQDKNDEELRIKEMMIEGVLSIQAGENPRIMEHKLKTFLNPIQRAEYEALSGEGGGDEE